MKWYNSLSINQKINLKQISHLITGMEFSDMVYLLGFNLSINTLYEKLVIEGIL